MNVLARPPATQNEKPAVVGKDFQDLIDLSEQVVIRGALPNKDLAANGAMVIEFFSTWCQPCCAFIGRLMQHCVQNKNIQLYQISPEPVEKLTKFFNTVKTPKNYNVNKVSAEVWEDLSNMVSLNGIPHALIFDGSICVYSGHPASPEFEAVLKALNAKIAAKKA